MLKPTGKLTHALHSFQSGELTHSEFLAQVDRALASNEDDSTRLVEMLDDERTRQELPPDVYAELQRRAAPKRENPTGFAGSETRMRSVREPLATMPSVPSMPGDGGPDTPDGAPERIKGVGDTLNGRFVLEECIGFGGMGMVYKALDLRRLEASDRNPYLAIKVLNVQFRGHPKSLIALQREAKKAQKLAHPNIVTVYDFDRDGTMVYLTMEYLPGQQLSKVLREPGFTGMPLADAMRIVRGMGSALAYAHERGFVHCDFKPANVILTESGEVKVIDFGIARAFQKPDEQGDATVFDPGSLGAMTPAYASPEILEHREPDPRDDIYALACIAYELLTGRHPFDRLPATEARNAGMKPQRPKSLGARQWQALRAALAFERAARTPTVARFLQEMSGEQRAALPVYLALVLSGAIMAVLMVTVFNHYRAPSGVPENEAASAALPAPAQPAPEQTSGASPEETESAETAAAETQSVEKVPAETARPDAPQPAVTVAAVAPVLDRVPCAALAPAVDGRTVQVRGFLPQSFGAARLQEQLAAIPGVQAVELDVQQVSAEKCGVIDLFRPYWLGNRQADAAASIRTQQAGGKLAEGDALVLDLTTPDHESYVNVDYYSFDGSVLHLVPSPRVQANQAPPGYAATIGGLGNWVVAPPFGTDLIVLLTTPAPLFERLRPESESTADYLRAVDRQLKQIAGKHGADKIAADFVQITTSARGR